MQYSTPGKKLASCISVHTAVIYARDPVRYKNLCRWVWTQQRIGWADEAIAEALRLGGPNLLHADDWWRYLTSLLKKANGRANESQAQKHKSEVGYIANEFIEFLKARRAG